MSKCNSLETNWNEITRVSSATYSALNFDIDVDVCVIGGGLAGLTVAREVALRGWSVAVLDAKQIARAASGQSVGFVLPGFDARIEDIVGRVGLDRAKELWALSERGLRYIRDVVATTKMPGVDPLPGWLNISKVDNDAALHAKAERLRWLGADVEFWPKERLRAAVPNPRYFSALNYRNAFHIRPLDYALGLAILAERAGAKIFEQTPAVSIDPKGTRKRIETPNARVKAAHVVLAGNIGLGSLMPQLAATLVPVTTFVLVTDPIPNLDERIQYRGAVSDTDSRYRIIDDNRLQWAGRPRIWQADPLTQQRHLLADIERNFPALSSGAFGSIKAAHIWCGTSGHTIHRMPQIAELEDGVWIASGFGNHGLNTTAMAGELIARGIVERDQTWRLFDSYGLVWAGGMLGRVLAQSAYSTSRYIKGISAALSRRRERRRTRVVI